MIIIMTVVIIISLIIIVVIIIIVIIVVIIITRPYATLVRPSLVSASFYAHYVEHLLRGKEARIES